MTMNLKCVEEWNAKLHLHQYTFYKYKKPIQVSRDGSVKKYTNKES